MILEIATWNISAGTEAAFEAAFAEGASIIASQRGFEGCELRRCLERPSRYAVLVLWRSLADHTEGFRGTPDHRRFGDLLAPFRDERPSVQHFDLVRADRLARAPADTAPAVLEIATLSIRPGGSAAFEIRFAEAAPILAASPGFRGLELQRCIEVPDRYALLVRWRSVEDHTQGFRLSAGYQEWRRLLHYSYDAPPAVEHYAAVDQQRMRNG